MSKPKEIVLDFDSNGQAQGMHFDQFDLGFLGDKHVTRASEIVYNDTTQLWDVVLPNQGIAHTPLQGFSGYDVARAFEVQWLQECRKREVDPYSLDGAVVAIELHRRAGN